jgi:hypothetical protein
MVWTCRTSCECAAASRLITALTSVTSRATKTVPRSRWRRSMSGEAWTWGSARPADVFTTMSFALSGASGR